MINGSGTGREVIISVAIARAGRVIYDAAFYAAGPLLCAAHCANG